MSEHQDSGAKPFAEIARTTRSSLVRDLWGLLSVTKKWWLLPIVAILLLISTLLLASSTAVAPFIYTLF